VRPFETRGAIEKNPQSRFDLLSEFSGTISRGGSRRGNGKRFRTRKTWWSSIGEISEVLDEFLAEQRKAPESRLSSSAD